MEVGAGMYYTVFWCSTCHNPGLGHEAPPPAGAIAGPDRMAHRDGEGLADPPHARVGQRSKPFDERCDRDAPDGLHGGHAAAGGPVLEHPNSKDAAGHLPTVSRGTVERV